MALPELPRRHLIEVITVKNSGLIAGRDQRVPYARLASLDLGNDRVGCDRLPLLGATDCKWMRELWGEPKEHSTAADLYETMWTLMSGASRLMRSRSGKSVQRGCWETSIARRKWKLLQHHRPPPKRRAF